MGIDRQLPGSLTPSVTAAEALFTIRSKLLLGETSSQTTSARMSIPARAVAHRKQVTLQNRGGAEHREGWGCPHVCEPQDSHLPMEGMLRAGLSSSAGLPQEQVFQLEL